jgi:signal transduction histidine kinase
MNEMLDRLEESSERQQRFVADASHELRSPLTRIRSAVEVDLAHPGASDLRATHASVLEDVRELQDLVDDLLQLARSDAAVDPDRTELVDLDDVVLRETDRLRARGGVTVDISGVSAAQVAGDPGQLGRAVRNLAENAARHAASRVAFTTAEHDGVAELTVSDDGPGIPEDQRERVFERFARLDPARRRGEGGTGLGLAITREIVTRHGGSIHVDPAHEPGCRFVLRIPREGVAGSRPSSGR